MKLYELTGVRAIQDKDLIQLLADISAKDSKFKKVGEGANAYVLSHSNGMIYKFWVKDSAYDSFINHVEKNQDDEHLPKLKSKVKELHSFFNKPADFPDKIKYIKMEKLTGIMSMDMIPGSKNLKIVDTIDHIYHELKTRFRHFKQSPGQQAVILGRILDDFTQFEGGELTEETKAIIASLIKTLDGIKNIPDIRKHMSDLHSGNIMKRGNTIVIIDPISNDDDMTFNANLETQLKKLNKELRNETK